MTFVKKSPQAICSLRRRGGALRYDYLLAVTKISQPIKPKRYKKKMPLFPATAKPFAEKEEQGSGAHGFFAHKKAGAKRTLLRRGGEGEI